MVDQNNTRAHGVSGVGTDARDASNEMTEPIVVELPEEDQRHMRSPKFSRMRFNWQNADDRQAIERAQAEVDRRMLVTFGDAYQIMAEIITFARIQDTNPMTGEPLVDVVGQPVWKMTPQGRVDEDYSRLTRRQKEHFIGLITVRLFAWEQHAGDFRLEALMSKASFEEHFAIGYERPMKGTIEERTALGNIGAAEDRYLAIYLTSLSHKADALVRSMDRICIRLRDVLTA